MLRDGRTATRGAVALVLGSWLLLAAAQPTAPTGPTSASAPASGTASAASAPAPPPAKVGTEASGEAPPRYTLPDGVVRVADTTAGRFEGRFVLQAEGLTTAQKDAPLEIVDLPEAAPRRTDVVFKLLLELPGSGGQRSWLIAISTGPLAPNEEQTRYARLRLGTTERGLSYVLSNRPKLKPELTVEVRSRMIVGEGDALEVNVSAAEQAVAGLRLVGSTLTEKNTGAALPLHRLALCTTPSSRCDAATPVPALSTATLWLRTLDGRWPSGRYAGTLQFAIDGRPDTRSVAVELSASAAATRVFGVLLIALGVSAAWALSVYARARADRLSLLKLATAMRARIELLLEQWRELQAASGQTWPALLARGAEMAALLTESALDRDGLLPAAMPSPWTAEALPLKARLDELEPKVAALVTLLRGAQALNIDLVRENDPTRKQVIEGEMRGLDAPDALATEAMAQQRVQKARDSIVSKRASLAGEGAGMQGEPPEPSAQVQLEEIRAELRTLSRGVWVGTWALTTLTGYAALILPNNGFGTSLDLVLALLWGFGLPMTLDKLQQLKAGDAGTALGVKLPRAAAGG